MPKCGILFLAASGLLIAGCKVRGFGEFDEKISTMTQRLDALEEAAGEAADIDLAGVDERLAAIEQVMGGEGMQDGSMAGLAEAIETVDSLQAGMAEMELLVASQRDSLDAAYQMLEASMASVDSLEDRIDDLEGEVASLHTAQSSGTSGTSRSGTSGGTSGRSGGTSGGSSGRSGGTGGGSSGGTSR